MAKITLGPKCRLCRREGEKLFLKGEKCFSTKCPVQSKAYPPGMHGKVAHFKLSPYGRQLRAKQKAKKIYYLNEVQLYNAYKRALRRVGSTDYLLMRDLEMRLGNVIYRAGVFVSPNQARQAISHGHFLLNGRRVDLPNLQVKEGDTFVVRESSRTSPLFANVKKTRAQVDWVTFQGSSWQGQVKGVPQPADQATSNIDFKAIVEFYSR